MFFYRAWAGNEDRFPQTAVYGPDVFVSPFYTSRWGYAALLILTIVGGVILNLSFLSSFVSNFSRQRLMPHILFLCLSIRDLLVALILIPIALDWYIVNIGFFEGGEIFCRFTAFADYYLAALYPIILVSLAIILYSRKYPELEESFYGLELGDIDPREADSMMESSTTVNPPSNFSMSSTETPYAYQRPTGDRMVPKFTSRANPGSIFGGSNASSSGNRQSSTNIFKSMTTPSVAGSETGYRPRSRGGAFQPQRPVILRSPVGQAMHPSKPESVTTSIEGRLATSSSRHSSEPQSLKPLTSLMEEDETTTDVWDQVSMEYPGNQLPMESTFLSSSEDPHSFDEPRFHTWHYWLLALSWFLALSIAVPGTLFVRYQPLLSTPSDVTSGIRKARPGCYMPGDPFKNPYSYTVNDPGFNFLTSYLSIAYIVPAVVLFILNVVIYCKKYTTHSKFRRYVKILSVLTFIFILSRSPMDIIQIKDLAEAMMGFKQLNMLPYQLEYEILLVWSTYIPLVANPIAYFCFCSEYRAGARSALSSMCGNQRLDTNVDEDKIIEEKNKRIEIIYRTRKTNIL